VRECSALEKLVDSAAAPDELLGDLLALVFNVFEPLAAGPTERIPA
jgi:hypothetical protein